MAIKYPEYGSGSLFSKDLLPTDAEVMNALTTNVKDLKRRAAARKGEDMSKRITETSYKGESVKPDAKKPVKKVTKKEVTVETPDGLRGSASGEMGPNMGKVNTAAEAYADAQARDAASRITEGGTDFSGMSRTAAPAEERVDMHEQARRSMGFKRGGAVRKKSGGSCGMKSGGSVKSSASRRGDGCAVRGKTKGRMI